MGIIGDVLLGIVKLTTSATTYMIEQEYQDLERKNRAGTLTEDEERRYQYKYVERDLHNSSKEFNNRIQNYHK